ncbi:hypothetical protein C4559_01345 [Candidatus Microgenomates bacterium]|nr:MAG: hypothetical protein C4559_01345 [Candidatus Microgenomates bacterium]
MLAQEFLPAPPLDLPTPEEEIPAHAHAGKHVHEQEMVKTLLSWSAPGRPFKKRSKEFYLSSLLIMFFIEIILFLFSQYLLMLVVLSLTFVSFALASVPPSNFHYRISTEGITVEDHFYLWQELYDFYFKKRNGVDVLHIRTKSLIPGELIIMPGDLDRKHILSAMLPCLPYREIIRPTFMENAGDWLTKNFPLERIQTKV